jgi:hypothetical protein
LGRAFEIRNLNGVIGRAGAGTVDFFRSHLKQVVSIHRAQFEKLLFEEDSDVGPELAELFQDAGRTYLQIAERISTRCESRQAAAD